MLSSLRRAGSSFFRGESDSDKASPKAASTSTSPAKIGFFRRAGSALFGGSENAEAPGIEGVFEVADKPVPANLREQVFGRDTSNDVQKYEPAVATEGDSDEDGLAALRRTGASFSKKAEEES